MEQMMTTIWNAFTQNVGTKLISIAVAVILWIVVLGSRNVEVTKDIPLEVITPSDVQPSNEIPDHISFRLSGPKAFLRAILDRREDPIRVNLSGSKPGLVTYRFFSDNIRVPIGVKVLSVNPTAILIKLEPLKHREVTVRPSLQGAPPEGFRILKAEMRPNTVRVKGAETRVDALSEINTSPVDVSSVRQTTEKEVSLELSRTDVQLDGPLPKIYIEMEALSANFRIKNVDIRVVSSYKVRLDDKTVTVLVRADAKNLRNLDKDKVFAVADLSGKSKGHYVVPVKVTLPDELGLVKVVPDKVGVTLY